MIDVEGSASGENDAATSHADISADVSSNITMTIKVCQGTSIKGTKGDKVNSFVRIQFADFDYKDTPVVTDTSNPEYNFSFEQQFVIDEGLVEIFCNKSINITIIESLPKEKTNILGIGEICLYRKFLNYFNKDASETGIPECPLTIKESIPIQYANSKMLAQNEKPEVVIEVSLSRPLLDVSSLQKGVFATFFIKDLYPLPEDWTLKEGNEKDLSSNIYSYRATLFVPSEKGNCRQVVFNNGCLEESEILVNQDPIENAPRSIKADTLDDIAPAHTQQKISMRRVVWNASTVIWLSAAVLQRMANNVQKKRPMELEVERIVLPKYSPSQEIAKINGVAYIDISIIMYPNIIGFKGRYILERNHDDFYKTLNSTIYFECKFSAPVMTKKRLEEISKSVSDFIPKRIVSPEALYKKNSEQAIEGFKKQIQIIIRKLISEYKETLKMEAEVSSQEISNITAESSAEQRKKLFIFRLNKSGAYFTFKEQLKSSVVQIVREKFQKKSPFSEKSELQVFMSQVYIYLVDEMHSALNKFFNEIDAPPSSVKLGAEFEAMLKFAQIAENNGQISIANKYHSERVGKYQEVLNAWFDYGNFCRRNQMFEKAEECYKEILSQNPKHIKTLLTYGNICAVKGMFEEARVYLNTAVEVEPLSVLANCVVALFYSGVGEDLEASKYYSEVDRICRQNGKSSKDSLIITAEFAVNAHLPELADQALAQEIIINGPSVKPYILLFQLEMQKNNMENAHKQLLDGLRLDPNSPQIWAALGHLKFIQKNFKDARIAYEKDLIYIRLGTIYLNDAYSIIDEHSQPDLFGSKKPDEGSSLVAKDMFLTACTLQPTSQSWLGVGKCCIALGRYEEAEDALAEANVLNHRDSDVWAYLAILCLLLDRIVEANQAVHQALKLGIKDHFVLRMLGNAFMVKNQISAAIEAFKMALELDPSDLPTRESFKKALDMKSKEYLGGEVAE